MKHQTLIRTNRSTIYPTLRAGLLPTLHTIYPTLRAGLLPTLHTIYLSSGQAYYPPYILNTLPSGQAYYPPYILYTLPSGQAYYLSADIYNKNLKTTTDGEPMILFNVFDEDNFDFVQFGLVIKIII